MYAKIGSCQEFFFAIKTLILLVFFNAIIFSSDIMKEIEILVEVKDDIDTVKNKLKDFEYVGLNHTIMIL